PSAHSQIVSEQKVLESARGAILSSGAKESLPYLVYIDLPRVCSELGTERQAQGSRGNGGGEHPSQPTHQWLEEIGVAEIGVNIEHHFVGCCEPLRSLYDRNDRALRKDRDMQRKRKRKSGRKSTRAGPRQGLELRPAIAAEIKLHGEEDKRKADDQ